ncbi:DDE-type integrase/transposase/recombinase [Chitinophaga sp. LS1]|uniref:DDE-type integrase/transposase/recombinase n=1 Tax=Chitinophaga sp. LS1 TaxID=3051176 RepID=UPI0039EF4605
MGHEFRHDSQSTVVAAWKMAIRNSSVGERMIFHSDRDAKYASQECRNLLRGTSVKQSMSRKGNCRDVLGYLSPEEFGKSIFKHAA